MTPKQKRGGVGAPRPRAPRAGKHKNPETAGAREGRWEERENTNKKKHPKHGQPQPGGGQAKMKEKMATGKCEAHQNEPGRPARPTRPRIARTHTHTHTGVASSDPKGDVSASTRNSPSAPAESPVERRTVQETGRVSDLVQTRQTTAAHAARDRSWRDPPGTTPSQGPKRVRRGARPARPCLGRGQRQAQ